MSASPTPYIDPELPVHPAGATCADCRNFRRCAVFVGREGHEVQCDWHPSAFAHQAPPEKPRASTATFRCWLKT